MKKGLVSNRLLASALRTHRNTYHDNVTLADQTFTDHRNTRRLADLVVEQAADTLAVTGRAAQEFTRSVTTGAAYAQQTYTGTVADADRFQTDVTAETAYSGLAIGHRNTNRLAQAGFNRDWANNVAGDASTLHQAQYNGAAQIVFDSAKAGHTTTRGANVRLTNLTRINDIGGAQTTRGTNLGNNEITQVTSYGNAGITLAGTLTTAEDSYDSAVQAIDAAQRGTLLGLWSGDQLDAATQEQLRTSSLGTAAIGFVNGLRPTLLSSATTLANAEVAYHLSLATTAATDAAANALTLGTPAAQFAADAATVQLTWRQQMAPAFVTFVNASAVAAADATRDALLAENTFQNNAATEDFNYLTNVLPLMTSLVTASAANSDTLHNNLSDTSQAHRLSSATADLTQGIDGATANKQHRLDRAGTRQTYETAQENADQSPGAGFPEFRTGEADAMLTRDTGVADADRTWRYSLAGADRTQTRDNATHQRNAQIVQAGLQQSFSNNQALADAGYATALAGHEQTYGSTLLTVDTARATALGNAQLDWLNASFAADVTALTQLDTLNADAGDWTNHLVQLATAQQAWWSTFAPNFTSFLDDVTDEWATEQTAANLEIANLATANNAADVAYTADVANATYQATTFLAGQYEQREFALADQDELFQQTDADARRTFDVTRASLTRDGDAAGMPLLEGVAVSQATPAYNTARQTARTAFDLNTALPVAAFSVTQSATNHWWTTQTNAFASTHAAARGTALDDFLTNSSQATLTRRQNVANRTSAFEQQWVSSQSAAVSLFATTNPTPWATYAATESAAEVDRTSTLAPARAAHDSNVANADHVLLEGLADSLAEFLQSQTTLDNNELLAEADNDLSSAILGANSFLNPGGEDTTGGSTSIDVLTAVNVPGATTAGAPGGFTFNAETAGAPPFLRALWQGPSALRTAAPAFAPETGALPDDHVEPTVENTRRSLLSPDHSKVVELQNKTEHHNSTSNAANPRTEEKQASFATEPSRAAGPPSVELQAQAELQRLLQLNEYRKLVVERTSAAAAVQRLSRLVYDSTGRFWNGRSHDDYERQLNSAKVKLASIDARLTALTGRMYSLQYLAGDEALYWTAEQKLYEAVKYAYEHGLFTPDIQSMIGQLLPMLTDPEVLESLALHLAAAGLKKLACKFATRAVPVAGAAATAYEGAQLAIGGFELKVALDDVTYKADIKDLAPKVAGILTNLILELGFAQLLKKITCFAAGTQIAVAMSQNADGSWKYQTKSIEDLRGVEKAGDNADWVLAREELGDKVALRRVLRTVCHSSDHLRVLEFEDANGDRRTLRTTDEHPFWIVDTSEARGRYVPAEHLEVGQSFTGPNGERQTLVASRREVHPDGIPVYNFEVEEFHTYFVSDKSASSPILTHNNDRCLPGADAPDELTPTHDHHTIPRQVRKPRNPNHDSLLPPHLREHPDIVGRPGNPNRWTIFAHEHVGPDGVHNRKRFPQGSYNERFVEEIDALRERKRNWNDWTEQDILEIRDRLVKEFDLERYRPE